MPTITSTTVEVYVGANGSGSLVGSAITKSGSPATVNLNSTELGAALSAGTQYSVRARCTNSDSVTSDWTNYYNFKTLIFAELLSCTGGSGKISPEGQLTYNSHDISVNSCGVYISTNASGANATKYTASDEQHFGQGWEITGLAENTTYYVVPWVKDDLNREFVGAWADAETVNTGYTAPTVVISNATTTTDSISGNITVSTNDTLSSVYIDLWPTGGQTHYRINKTATTGLQTFTITDGDTDANGNTIPINPSTEYRITVYAQNTSGAVGSDLATVTTAQAVASTIAITGVDNITPTSGVVNLSYNV